MQIDNGTYTLKDPSKLKAIMACTGKSKPFNEKPSMAKNSFPLVSVPDKDDERVTWNSDKDDCDFATMEWSSKETTEKYVKDFCGRNNLLLSDQFCMAETRLAA